MVSKRVASIKVAATSHKRREKQPASRSKAEPRGFVNTRKAQNSSQLGADRKEGTHHRRSNATVKRLEMYKAKPDLKKMREKPQEPCRIQPDRKWFTNTRVVSQTKLEEFREAMDRITDDPYAVVVKRAKLPTSLFDHTGEKDDVRGKGLLKLRSFGETFGKKSTRKRPKIAMDSLEEFAAAAAQDWDEYVPDKDRSLYREDDGVRDKHEAEIFKKGTSKRIWGELHKVIDSADIICQVIDARDPMGTRCRSVEKFLKKEKPHKYMVLILNKVDLVPNWVASRWVKILSAEYPTVAFHAHEKKGYGRMTLLNLLRQYAKLLKDRRHVSMGFIGFPNAGKSSVINSLKKDRVCKTAPVPGETKVWQYIMLTSRIHLIDCPGIVPPDKEQQGELNKVLRGVVRAEKLEDPEDFIDPILERVDPRALVLRYNLDKDSSWPDADAFLDKLALTMGKLKKGGEPNQQAAARIVIYDWQRGRLPFYTEPPRFDGDDKFQALPDEKLEVVSENEDEEPEDVLEEEHENEDSD